MYRVNKTKMVEIPNYDRIELAIVKRLFNYGCWGKGHLLIMRLRKGIPKEDVKYVDKVLKLLNKKQIILVKRTKYGDATFLNANKREEIDKIRSRDNF